MQKKNNKKTITKTKKESVRLVPHIKPVKYTLTLKPDLEAFTFEGSEVIDIVTDKAVSEITLHSKDLDITTVEVLGKNKKDAEIFASKITYNEKAETATFTFKNKIPKGKIKLKIVFSGIISEGLRGFYRSRYTLDGKVKNIATTQFEATDARRAFPSFDEPAHKAVFDLSLIIPGTHTAISNTLPTKISEHEGGYKVVEFASTPKMSTYLLAFIIGEFEYVEGWAKPQKKEKLASKNRLSLPLATLEARAHTYDFDKQISPSSGTQVRVFTTAGKKHQAKFALDVAIKSLEFYNDYFGVPYPLPTLDLIALPDFESAAMENWGAVTFRETALLVDDEHTSFANKQWVAIVIAHELAHQWFGNLVTMHWWTDLWLNEGFASYMEYLCTDHMFPEWKVWDLYLAERYSLAMRLDALANSHPIEVEVHHPNEINEIFDMVSYAKGSGVIRMVAEYLGADVFKKGLQYYMKKHSYGNTKTVDLWEAFEKVSGKPVKKMMREWTGKTGYPLLALDNKNKITQERFFSSRISKEKNKENTVWQIPLSYKDGDKTKKVLISKKSSLLEGKDIGKLNAGEVSMLRVKYDEQTLSKLKNQILEGSMHMHDRLGIARDIFALAEAGYISATVALEFAEAFKNENEYIVWAELASGIDKVYSLISEEVWVDNYKKYALQLFSPLAHRLGWHAKSASNTETFLRNLALSHAALYGDDMVIKYGKKLLKESGKTKIPADIRSVVYGIVARDGKEADWNKFKAMYKGATLDEERDRCGRALAQFRDKTLLAKTLTFALSKDVRMQDAPFLIGAVWGNSKGRDLSWQFVKHNWETLLKKYGEGGHFLGRVLSPLGTHTTIADAKDITKFFKKNVAPGAARTIEQSLEKIYSNASWIKADKDKIKKWLEKNTK
jgi:puromycin-sensitive aminopeptidase